MHQEAFPGSSQRQHSLESGCAIETALDPNVAEAVTIGGMKNVVDAMRETGVRKVCFTDSIGSFGATAPRKNCTARWLTENPTQDPGSDYGRQKRGCRELLKEFAADGGDPRWAVLPGVLHNEAIWGNGTTEYALEAMDSAARGDDFECPVDPNVEIPMIYVSDLMRGLVSLQYAPESQLREPERGYCIPGLSFTAEQLFKEIRRYRPGFRTTVKLDPNMNKFANLWPDDLSKKEPKEDLNYSPKVGLREMVAHCMTAHEERLARSRVAFRVVDADGNGTFGKGELQDFLNELLEVPESMPSALKGIFCEELTDRAFEEMDLNKHGRISYSEFHVWCKRNTLCDSVRRFVQEKEAANQRFQSFAMGA